MICEKCKQETVTRSSLQNRALHKYFELIAIELNELGQEFCYTGISGKQLQMRYTQSIIKEMFWKPIQQTMFGTNTTTKLDTKQINEIVDVFSKFFAERGVVLSFPSIDTLNEKE